MTARFNYGLDRHADNMRVEWWDIYDSDSRFVKTVKITYSKKWFHACGSINDLKEMAINEAKKKQND